MAGEPQKVLSCCNKLGEFEAQGGALAQYPTFLADWRWSKIADSPLPSAIEGEKGAILIGKWDTMSPPHPVSAWPGAEAHPHRG